MIGLARIETGRLTPARRHAPREEYFAWVRHVLPNPAGVKMRRYFYNRVIATNRCERNHRYLMSRLRHMRGLKSVDCAKHLFPISTGSK